jgi:SAM-dependent methyltransferase
MMDSALAQEQMRAPWNRRASDSELSGRARLSQPHILESLSWIDWRDKRVLEVGVGTDDFPDSSFDVVYSFGVLPQIPQVGRAVDEIHRVLKPGGELLLMLHNRTSINYRLEIMLRKLGLRSGGADGPYCRVYNAREAEELLAGFEILRTAVRFFDHRPWGVLGRLLPPGLRRGLGRRWGWHRIVHARKPVTAPYAYVRARVGAKAGAEA